MAKPKIKTTQEASTAETPRCPVTGRPLDEWGLPLNGPARVAALAELGKPDPRDEPDAWESGALIVPPVVLTTDVSNGDAGDGGNLGAGGDTGTGDDPTDLNGDRNNG